MRSTAGVALTATLAAMAASATPARSGAPALVGTCAFSVVRQVSQRLESDHQPVANSGSSIELANGVWGVSYDQIAAVNDSRAGDRVMTCLAILPRHCPPGDRRGRIYTTTNLRTQQSWTLPDSEHSCGGA